MTTRTKAFLTLAWIGIAGGTALNTVWESNWAPPFGASGAFFAIVTFISWMTDDMAKDAA